ncbi:hypothetical protein GCM10023331_39140 [Algivirga pacifica]|uniref:Adenylate-forming enzyme n=2 Tax=Algivirga pacifica TaxID=1162670 RepID=A0ABP9DNS8_9BACT
MESFDEINTVGIRKEEAMHLALQSEVSRDFSPMINGISIGLSSGTSGSRGMFLTSKKEQERWVAAILDRVIGFSFKKRSVAFFLRANNNLYEAVGSRLLQFHFYDIKTSVDTYIPLLLERQHDLLVAQPSVLQVIAAHYEQHGLVSSFTKVISVAEVLEEDMKARFEAVFNCPVHQVYQCTEGFLAYTCSKGNLHFNEDFLKIEKKYLDDEKVRFHPIITDYQRTSQPVVRYELNDILHEGGPCTCGSKTTVIKKIEGRADDVFTFHREGETIRIYPDFIRRAIIQVTDDLENYQVSRVGAYALELVLYPKSEKDLVSLFEKVKGSLQQLFQSYGIAEISITLHSRDHNPINKFKRINNEYAKKL